MGTSATELSHIQPHPPEQRLSVRKRVSLPTPIELLPGKETWLLDLGEGGLCVTGSSRLDLGTVTGARFLFRETNSVIDAAGVVAWSDDSGRTGIRFTRVEPESTAALRRWLKTGALISTEQSAMKEPVDRELATRISCLSEVADLQSSIAAQQLDCDAALDLIVRRMAKLTRATGAAIALREGDDVVCRAREGDAPDVGVRLSPSSLSGSCLQSGAIVMLEDSENDPRVNPEVCRQLSFRSFLVVPVTSGTEIIGIAEVLSSEAHNFAGGDVLVLSFLADLIATVTLPRIDPDPNATPEVFRIPIIDDLPPVAETEAGMAEDLDYVSPSAAEIASASNVESPVSISPEDEFAESAILVSSDHSALSSPIVNAVIHESNLVSTTVSLKTSTATRFRKPEASALEVAPRSDIFRMLPLAVTCVVLLATAALLAGYYFSRSAKPKAVPSISAASTAAAAPVNPGIPAPMISPHTQTLTVPAPATHSQTKPSAVTPERQTAVSAPTPTIDELTVIHGASHAPASPIDSAAPDAPVINPAARASGSLPASLIATKTAAPILRSSPTSQGVVEGKLLRKVVPQYPEMARHAGVSGDVILSAKIAIDGTLQNLKVVTGSPLLRAAAIDAAKQWRYSPYMLDGKPVEADTRITISFRK